MSQEPGKDSLCAIGQELGKGPLRNRPRAGERPPVQSAGIQGNDPCAIGREQGKDSCAIGQDLGKGPLRNRPGAGVTIPAQSVKTLGKDPLREIGRDTGQVEDPSLAVGRASRAGQRLAVQSVRT